MRLTRPEGPTDQDFRFSRRALATGGLTGLMFAGYAPAALAQDASPIVTDSEGLVTETIAYSAPDARRIAGAKSKEIEAILGYRGRDEMIHRDDLVLD